MIQEKFLSELESYFIEHFDINKEKFQFTPKQLSSLFISNELDINWNEELDLPDFNITDLVRKIHIITQDNCKKAIGKETIEDRLIEYSKTRLFSPIKDFLKPKGKFWDGIKRVDNWIYNIFKLENNSYNSSVGKAILVNIIDRAFNPNSNVSQMVIIRGEQNIGKSYFLNALVTDKYFVNGISLDKWDINKTAVDIMGKLVAEFGELNTNRNEDDLKKFISRNIDTITRKYERSAKDFRRTAILISTSNNNEVLNDPTGNRRYMILEPTNKQGEQLDFIDYINENREQLFLEAYEIWKSEGVKHIDLPKEIEIRNSLVLDGEEQIEEILNELPEKVKIGDIKELYRKRFMFDKPLTDQKIGKILIKLGFSKHKSKTSNYWARG